MKTSRLAKRSGAGRAYQRAYQRNVQRTAAARTLQGAIRQRQLRANIIPNNIPLGTFRRTPRFPKAEAKAVDIQFAPVAIIDTLNTNGFMDLMTPIQLGTAAHQRVGNVVQGKGLRLKLAFQYIYARSAVNSVLQGNRLRVMVVVWKQTGQAGTFPNFNGFFGGTDQTGGTFTSMKSSLFFNRINEFTILRDWNIEFKPIAGDLPAVNQTATVPITIDDYIKLGGLETRYINTANPITVANCSSNAIFTIMRAAQNTADTSISISQISMARFTYYDS